MTFLGPLPADETSTQGVVYVTVTCFDEGAADAVARSEQAAKDAQQTVTTRDDLGDGGFAATDEGGSNFVQLRHGDVVVYLAASAEVDPTDVDGIASAYDKALGGDGGAVAVGTQDPGVEEPSDELVERGPERGAAVGRGDRARARGEAAGATVDGTVLTIDSAIGTDVLGEDQSSRAITAALRAAGKTPADLTLAQAYDETQAADLSIIAFAVDGLSDAKTRDIVLDSWLSASGAGVTRSDVQLGGTTVTRIDYGDDGTKDYVVTRDGAVVVITTADEALATRGDRGDALALPRLSSCRTGTTSRLASDMIAARFRLAESLAARARRRTRCGSRWSPGRATARSAARSTWARVACPTRSTRVTCSRSSARRSRRSRTATRSSSTSSRSSGGSSS